MNKQLTVIGGGAAGMMAAICAARRGTAVTLLEPNERLGKKLNITGKGRCNVTNDAGCEELLANVPQNGRFLYSAFSRFDGRGTMAFFEELGVPLKVERGRRVFPVSDRAFDVSAALERELRRLRVTLVRDRAVCVLTDETGAVRGVKGEKGTYPAQAVVLATGGVSYRGTGSTGEGHRIAAMLGHTVTPLTGSLVPLRADGCAELQGLSLRNVGLTVYENGKRIYTDFGELLFTHFGVSGPLVLTLSSVLATADWPQVQVTLNLKPALTPEQLDARLLREFAAAPRKQLQNILPALLPARLAEVFPALCGVSAIKQPAQITAAERARIVSALQSLPLTVTGTRGMDEAIVTCGGVSVREIVPATMMSKKVNGLFFAGEMMDVDAFTGGFNLQIAFSTGALAGHSAAVYERE